MKTVKNKMMIALAFMSVTSVSNAVTITDRMSATADIVFEYPANPLSLILTPLENLVAGEYEDQFKVADFQVTTTTPAIVGVALTGGLDSQMVFGQAATLYGANNPEHELNVVLLSDEAPDGIVLDNETWVLSEPDVTSFSGYVASSGTIYADAYSLTLDAAVYHP